MNPTLVIVSGAPASGKTTLCKQMVSELGFPLMSKDMIKEDLFDLLGWTDREWSKKLGVFSIQLLFAWVDRNLANRQSCIVDSNFKIEWDLDQFLKFQTDYSARLINIHCTADKETLMKRFERRANNGQRHPGHCDSNNLEEFRDITNQPWLPVLGNKDDILEVDSTNFSPDLASSILRFVQTGKR